VRFRVEQDGFATVVVRPWRRYQFYVSSVNELGESDLSEAESLSQCVTPAAVPSTNPSDVCSRLEAPKKLVIVWEVQSTLCFRKT